MVLVVRRFFCAGPEDRNEEDVVYNVSDSDVQKHLIP